MSELLTSTETAATTPKGKDSASALPNKIKELSLRAAELREAEVARIIREHDRRARIPNPIFLDVNVVSLLDHRFTSNLIAESRGRPGVFLVDGQEFRFEFMAASTLRTEAGALWTAVQSDVTSIDVDREVLLLFHDPVEIRVETEGSKEAENRTFNMLRLRRKTTTIEIEGVPVEFKEEGGL